MKCCGKCHETKPFSAFHKHGGKEDGHHHWCRTCRSKHDNPNQARRNSKSNPRRQMTHRGTNSNVFPEIPRDNFNAQFAAQNFCCAGTGRPTSKPVLDHDHHKGGLLRAIISHQLNVLIGKHDDSIPSLLTALEKPHHPHKNNHNRIKEAIDYLSWANEPAHKVAFTAQMTGMTRLQVSRKVNAAVKIPGRKAKNYSRVIRFEEHP